MTEIMMVIALRVIPMVTHVREPNSSIIYVDRETRGRRRRRRRRRRRLMIRVDVCS